MASVRGFAEFPSEWGGCGRDAYDLDFALALDGPVETNGPERNRKLIARTIERQIIPHLLLASDANQLVKRRSDSSFDYPKADEIIRFVGLLIDNDVAVASQFVEDMCNRGASLEIIFLNLFTPSARYLGKLWERDRCNFTQVTIALSRLQQLLRELSGAFEAEGKVGWCGRTALLVAAPGDQHTFGVFILQEFFRRAGWEVQGGSLNSQQELVDLVSHEEFDLVGLSVSNDAAVEGLAEAIRAIREAASRRVPFIMVGGRFFLDGPQYVADVGADATAQDGRRAVLAVSSLLPPDALG